MRDPEYNPAQAHEYYLRTRELKGRSPAAAINVVNKVGAARPVSTKPRSVIKDNKTLQREKVVRLTGKLNELQSALKEAKQALQKLKVKDAETKKKNSDDKTTAKERQASKEYRDKNQNKLAAKAKAKADSKPTEKLVSEMNVGELTERITKINGLINEARSQISQANSLAHSEFTINSGRFDR